jgi:hypothetical protein
MASRVEDVLAAVKLNDLLNKKQETVVVEEKKSTWKTVLIIIGIVTVVAVIAYAVYKFMTPDYLDDFDDDFDDDFFDDDDFVVDESEKKDSEE